VRNYSTFLLSVLLVNAVTLEARPVEAYSKSIIRIQQSLRFAQICAQLEICQSTLNQCGATCNNMVNTINGDKQAWLNGCLGNCQRQYTACYNFQSRQCVR
jgi:hypothetical protein